MTHQEMITFFKQSTGRFNLSDEKVTELLNNGGQLLHSKLVGHYGEVFHILGVTADDNSLDVSKYLASIKEIFYIGDTGTIARNYTPLKKYTSFSEFVKDYPNHDSTGVPTAFCIMPPLSMPAIEDMTSSVRLNERWRLDRFGSGNPVVALLNTRVLEHTDMRVLGTAQIKALVKPEDTNYLSQQFPMILHHAAVYFLELGQRSYQEAAVILQVIDNMIQAHNIASLQAQVDVEPNEVL